MTREELIKKVALKMDEISSSDDIIVSVGADDNNPLYTQINNLLNESINDVLTKAPVYRLGGFVDYVPSDSVRVDNSYCGSRQVAIVAVPEDFIRIAAIRDALFHRPIVDLAIEGDETDKRQYNRFLMAKNSKPVAVIGRINGARVITIYSYGNDEEPKPEVMYVQRFNGDLDLTEDIDLDEYLADVVTWACAGKVFAVQGDLNKAKTCDDNAAAIMI